MRLLRLIVQWAEPLTIHVFTRQLLNKLEEHVRLKDSRVVNYLFAQ